MLKINQLTSLTTEETEKLLEIFRVKLKRRQKQYTLQGKRRQKSSDVEFSNTSLLGASKKLEFMLIYLKGNMNQSLLGAYYKMSQSKVSQWFSYLLPVLEESLKSLGCVPVYQDSYEHWNLEDEYVIGDITEREIGRKICRISQKEDYSGKQKSHTSKNYALCDPKGLICFISASYPGKNHDKAIFDELDITVENIPFLMDLGFLGTEQDSNTILLPYKAPKGKVLCKIYQDLNRLMASTRVKIEHVFAGLKRLKMMKEQLRIWIYQKREAVLRISAALHNLRTLSRLSLQNYS